MTRYHSPTSVRTRTARRKQDRNIFRSTAFPVHYPTRNHNKKKPGDCGQVRCGICHYDKYFQRGWVKPIYYLADLRLREQLAEL